MARVVGVRFRKACKVYDFNPNDQDVKPGDTVIVEVDRGLGMGTVAYEPKEKDAASISRKLKNVIRKADTVDMERQSFNREREKEAFNVCKERIKATRLDMKLIRVEYLFDSSKAIFYFTSDGRIDFRVLVKDLASRFHTRIEMNQIGVRDEAKVVGGIGPCGRELCCTSYLSNFAPVTVKMAKEQNLALNPSKISGICGRLMCCLSYEYRSYQKTPGGRRPSGRGPSGRAASPGGDAKACSDGSSRPTGGCCAVPGKDSEGRSGQGEGARPGNSKPDGSKPVAGGESKAGGTERPERERRPRRRRRRRPRAESRGSDKKGPNDGAQGGGGASGGGASGGGASGGGGTPK